MITLHSPHPFGPLPVQSQEFFNAGAKTRVPIGKFPRRLLDALKRCPDLVAGGRAYALVSNQGSDVVPIESCIEHSNGQRAKTSGKPISEVGNQFVIFCS